MLNKKLNLQNPTSNDEILIIPFIGHLSATFSIIEFSLIVIKEHNDWLKLPMVVVYKKV